MKKRVLSALLVLCMACSMVSTVWATETNATSGAPEPASQTLNLDNEQSGDESGADSTSAPGDSTDSTSASSDSTSSGSSSAASDAASDATSGAVSDATSGEGDESAASSDSTAASDSTSSSSSASSDSSDSDADDPDAASSDVTGDESSTGTEEENDPAVEQPSASPEPVPSQPNRAPVAPQASDDGISTFAVSGETGTDSNQYNRGNNYYNPQKATYTYNLIRGEDTSEDITIHVFDYDTDLINQDNGSQRPFRFSEDPGEESDYHWDDINKYHKGTNGTMTGIVQDRLQDGYPVLSTGQSLDYLFTTNEEVSGKHNHLNANNLFQIDSEGYYYFDSSENFATLALDESNDFWLYRDVANTGDNSVPQFLPFNTMDRKSTWERGFYGPGSWKSSDGIAEDTNYHFGMTVEFDFLMPEGGTLEDGSPMTFEFTGDDDVWVFIDDCLVLDLGGIHDPISGTINFATGQVTRSGNVVGNLTNMVDEWDGAAYQTHTLKFFYLERGGGGSNCQLKFNMPTIPKNAVAVNKRVTGDVPENAPEAYTMQFVPESWPTTEPGEEIKAGTSEETAKTLSASNAAFTVTPGTPTYIYNVPSNLAYQIKEIEVDEGVSVSFNGTAATPVQGVAVSEMFGAGTRSVTVTNNYPLEPVTPEHRKYVERNEDGTYDLTLDVTGAVDTTQGEAQKIDILYVLDNSTSMDDPVSDSDRTRRLTAAKNAITVLETALGTDGIDVQHAMVIFSSEDYKDGRWNVDNTYTYQTWTSEPLNLTAISTTDHAHGTNYQAGIREAKTVLQQGTRDDAIQVVIFISDGEPNRPGNGLFAAKTEISDLNADRLYAIGVSDEVGLDTLTSLIDSAKNIPGENKNAYSSSNSEQLAEIFRGLAAEILSADVSNVTITDTLSEYAQLTEDATFTLTIDSGNTPVDFTNRNRFSIEDAQKGLAKGSFSYGTGADRKTVNFTITYTPATPANPETGAEATPASFSLDFDDGYKLENGWTYSITTQIEPTDAAYDYYRDHNQYPNTGEADTDAPDVVDNEDYISEGKFGFFSNSRATLTYNSAEQVNIPIEYNKPVIQVDKTSLTITKVFQDENGTALTAKEVESLDLLTNTKFTVKDSSGEEVAKDQTLTNHNGTYSVTVSDLYIGGTYTIEETSTLEGYTVATTVNPGKSGNEAVGEITLAKDATRNKVAFTNKYTPAAQTLTITKNVTGAMGSTEKEFQFTITLMKDGTYYGGETGETLKVLEVKQLGTDSIKKGDMLSATTGDNAKFTFTLRSGEMLKLQVPYGYQATVSEAPDGYTATSQITPVLSSKPDGTGDATVIFTTDKDYTIAYTNHLDPVPPTGLESNHTTPYVLMITAAGMAGLALIGGIVARRIRRRREE
ncbi:fibro-slime domain-containing protein [uncultured Gemmiger sp.]|uniref:DUF7604 domain-containing protein n=1 Tax=uncultured Gemmiger sp. TaxID=1623490 RepID=UPI0025F20916|nr:fibro-slime domain-containing protein [uncultured Gemmiger sp.]